MIRCCLCREKARPGDAVGVSSPAGVLTHIAYEPTDLPGTGWRCVDRDACRTRVAEIVAAHRGLLEIVGSDA